MVRAVRAVPASDCALACRRALEGPESVPSFVRGDTNADGELDIADAIWNLFFLFGGIIEPACMDALDANDDAAVDIADVVAILSHLFASSGPLPPPSGECGSDPTEDPWGCVSYPPCDQ